MKRPLVQLTLAYVAGVLVADFFFGSLGVLFVLSMMAAGVAVLVPKVRVTTLLASLFFTGWTNSSFHSEIISPYDVRLEFGDKPEIVTLRGRLNKTPKEKRFVWDEKESWRSVAELDVTAYRRKTEWSPIHGTVLITTRERLPSEFYKGELVEVDGVVSPPPGPAAEGLFDYRTFLRRQGIYYQLKADAAADWKLVGRGTIIPLPDRFAAWTKKVLSIGVPEDDTTHLLWTLVLDWKTLFTDEAEEPFMQAGTYHIFAVDGLRIAIITGIFLCFFRFLRLKREWCALIVLPLIWFYTVLTDSPASAIRASIMMTVMVGGWALRRPTDLFNSLFAAAFIILLWQPQQLFQAGFQLSFFVVLCIALILPVLEKFREWLFKGDAFLPDELRPAWRKRLDIPLRYLAEVLFSSWAAWIGSLPLAAYYFHLLTPVSTPANLLVVPLTVLTLISCLLSLLFAWCSPLVSVFNNASWALMKVITSISQWSADLPGACYYVSAPGLLTIAVFYLFLLAFHTHWFWRSKRKVLFGAVLAAIAVSWASYEWIESGKTRIHVLPLSGGHAVFVEASRKQDSMLIDCGNASSAQFVIKPFLRAHGVNQLEHFVLTHGDLRYVGGADIISTNFHPKNLYISPVKVRSAAYRDFVSESKNAKQPIATLAASQRCGLFDVLHPAATDQFSQADDNALVFKGLIGRTRVLLCADLARAGQRALLARTNDFASDIVVAGLPRKDEPVSDDLLNVVNPKLLVVADCDAPATERAPARLRHRLASKPFPVLYGQEHGSVLFEVGYTNFTVVTSR